MTISRFDGARLQPRRKTLSLMVALAAEGLRCCYQLRAPSAAKADLITPNNGAAEAAPLQRISYIIAKAEEILWIHYHFMLLMQS